jgi:23S rRNA pseudouridine1911/1915/1917 synthase
MGASETTRELLVPAPSEGARLDVFLRDHLGGLGRAAVRRLIEDGRVLLNARRATGSERVRAGQRVLVRGEVSAGALPDESAPLELAYEDDACVVANKPAGMASHPLAPGELGTLASALVARFPEMANLGYSPREPGIVHRLDTDTSGVVLAARSQPAFDALRAQLEAGAIDKRYFALCQGVPDGARIGVPLHAALSARGPRVHVALDEGLARQGAQPITTTIVRVISTHAVEAFALIEVRAARARRHQVRAHLAALGHPLAGDALYGGPMLAQLSHHFLHAGVLVFEHPATHAAVRVEVPLPANLRVVLGSLD